MNCSVGVTHTHGRLVYRRGTGGSIVFATKGVAVEGDVQRRRAALRIVDRQLSKGNFKLALSLIKQLQRHPSPARLRGFAAAIQVPRRVSSIEQLHLSVTETSALQSLLDAILDSIKSSLQLESSPLEDEVSLFGLQSSSEDNELYLEDDTIDHKQVVQHEAGHFLVGYLLGVLPKQYTFSSTEGKIADASVKFVGFEFLKELDDIVLSNKTLHEVKPAHRANKLKLSSTVLNKLACVLVGGLVAEHLAFGHSKGHHGDIHKLDRVLKWLNFSEDEVNNLTKWAVLNTLTILYCQREARSSLVEAMLHGRSIGSCIDSIETNINHQHVQ